MTNISVVLYPLKNMPYLHERLGQVELPFEPKVDDTYVLRHPEGSKAYRVVKRGYDELARTAIVWVELVR